MNLFELVGIASNLIGIAGALFALMAWRAAKRTQRELAAERARLNEPIEVALVLISGQERRELPVALRRAELTRAELLGRLGMLPMKEPGKRFSLAWLATPAFLARLAEVQAGHGRATIVIPCSEAEFEQFV